MADEFSFLISSASALNCLINAFNCLRDMPAVPCHESDCQGFAIMFSANKTSCLLQPSNPSRSTQPSTLNFLSHFSSDWIRSALLKQPAPAWHSRFMWQVDQAGRDAPLFGDQPSRL